MNNMGLATEDRDDLDVDPLRESLRAAYGAKSDALLKLKEAEDAQTKGEALFADAETQLRQHDNLEERIAGAEAQRLVDLAAGRPAAGLSDRNADEEESEKRARQRRQLEVKLAAAKKARSLLEGEVAMARNVVTKTDYAISAATEAILIAIGDDFVDEPIATETRAKNLRIELTGLSRIWVRAGGGPIKLGRRAITALADMPINDVNRQRPSRAAYDPEGTAAARYRRLAAALMADPDATISGMED
jgi:hypothetical protein